MCLLGKYLVAIKLAQEIYIKRISITMKNYKGFYREAKGNLPRIYCDMDGVLTDFVLAAKKATGQNWEGMRHGQDWESIKNTPNFWSQHALDERWQTDYGDL